MLGTDQLAVAALKLLASRNVRVPQDVLVTGFRRVRVLGIDRSGSHDRPIHAV